MSALALPQRARHAVISAAPSTWALCGALLAVAVAEVLVNYSTNIVGSVASGLVLEGLVAGCVLAARGSGGRTLPPLSAALLVLGFVPLERLASLALPAHQLPRTTWSAAVGAGAARRRVAHRAPRGAGVAARAAPPPGAEPMRSSSWAPYPSASSGSA